MPTTVLIQPDQRLLGSALGDLTLYGAQPTAGVAPARADDATYLVPGSDGASSSPVSVRGLADAAPSPSIVPSSFLPAAAAEGSATPTSLAVHGASATALGGFPAFTSVPAAPAGAGSFIARPLAADPHGATPAHAEDGSVVASPTPIDHEPASAPPALVPPGVAPLTALVSEPSPAAPEADHLAGADQSVAAAAVADQLVATVGPLAHQLTDAAVPVAAAVEQLAGAPAPVESVIDHVGTPVAAEAAGALATVEAVTDHLADVAAPVVAPAVDSLAAPAAAVVAEAAAAPPAASGLEGLTGSDPAAGIHTLVGMVQTADAFDLSHTTSSDAAAAPSIVESLSADEAPSSLLGDHHDPSDLSHAVDSHATHLGL